MEGVRQTHIEVLCASLHMPCTGEEHLADVVAGYGAGVDLDVIRGWWSVRAATQ
jgi:hypothetical protein